MYWNLTTENPSFRKFIDYTEFNLTLRPANTEHIEAYVFTIIQTEGKVKGVINVRPQSNSKSRIVVYVYAENHSEIDCVVSVQVPVNVFGAQTDVRIRSWPFDRSKIKARPEMFIANNDVVATHGNALGILSDEQQYYLASRGIENYKVLVKESLLNA